MPRLAKVVNVLAIRQVKQGTKTTRGNMLALDLIYCQGKNGTNIHLLINLYIFIYTKTKYIWWKVTAPDIVYNTKLVHSS